MVKMVYTAKFYTPFIRLWERNELSKTSIVTGMSVDKRGSFKNKQQ